MDTNIGNIGQDQTRPIQPTDHTMAILCDQGDTKTIWDKNNTVEVENARRTFNELKAKNYVAYRVVDKADKGEIMKEFDPNAERMIMAPMIVGG